MSDQVKRYRLEHYNDYGEEDLSDFVLEDDYQREHAARLAADALNEESRMTHDGGFREAFKLLGIDHDEYRWKWLLSELLNVLHERDQLHTQLAALRGEA